MSNLLLLELYDFRALSMDIVPAHPVDRGGTLVRDHCSLCKKWHTVYRLHDSWLKFDPRHSYLPAYWPDILGNHIFHERVVNVLVKEAATGFTAYPMGWDNFETWAEVAGSKVRELVLPTYYRIEVSGQVDANIVEIDDGEGSVCPECHAHRGGKSKKYPWSPKRLIPVPGSWDGSDFCNWRNFRYGSSLCSRRIVDLAASYGWTGVFGDTTPGVCIQSPVRADWFVYAEEKIRALHPDQFEN